MRLRLFRGQVGKSRAVGQIRAPAWEALVAIILGLRTLPGLESFWFRLKHTLRCADSWRIPVV
jgi:hypothetical protein